jgi:DNA-directed RNA polymerase specialized sigma24 family protein
MCLPQLAKLLDRLQPVRRWRKHRRLARMRKAVLALSPLHQSVFRMIRFESLLVEEAARQLDLDPQRVEELLTALIIALVVAA